MSYFLQILTMEFIDSSDEEAESSDLGQDVNLDISENTADTNYMMAGTEVPEPPDEISTTKYQHLMLNDQVHLRIMEVLAETRITFPLSDFQLVSLHVLGNKLNLILISQTGSGKMLGKYNIHF